MEKYKVGYLAGVFDLFHVGHLNLIRRAKERCDYLIVGALSDELVVKFKKNPPYIPFEERKQILEAIRYVDEVVKVTEENIVDLLGDELIICEAFDRPEAKAMLVNGVLEHFPEKKLVSATGMAGYGSSNTIRTKRLMKNFYLCGDGVTEPEYGNGLMAPRVAICAAHEANMITRLILGEEEI